MDPLRPSTHNPDMRPPENLDQGKPDSADPSIQSPDDPPGVAGGINGGRPANPAAPMAGGDPTEASATGVDPLVHGQPGRPATPGGAHDEPAADQRGPQG